VRGICGNGARKPQLDNDLVGAVLVHREERKARLDDNNPPEPASEVCRKAVSGQWAVRDPPGDCCSPDGSGQAYHVEHALTSDRVVHRPDLGRLRLRHHAVLGDKRDDAALAPRPNQPSDRTVEILKRPWDCPWARTAPSLATKELRLPVAPEAMQREIHVECNERRTVRTVIA
jgi:hypothetical protein